MKLARQLESRLEGLMVLLAFVWIALTIVEFAGGERRWMVWVGNGIWVVFVLDYLLRLVLAQKKAVYIRRNLLTLISIALPALRVFRLARLLRLGRAARGLRLLRLTTSLNRSVRALMRSMGRKGLGYVVALTVIVVFAGAAGMYVFERDSFASYGDALWWTAMVITTMGTESWPTSLEGRILCLALAIYAFSIFGYVTAALASFLVERESPPYAVAPEAGLVELRQEVAALAELVRHERQAARGDVRHPVDDTPNAPPPPPQ